MLPLLVYGALGALLWLSRKAPAARVALVPGSPPQLTGQSTPTPMTYIGMPSLAVQAVEAAMALQQTGSRATAAVRHASRPSYGWAPAFVDPGLVLEDGADVPFAAPGAGPFGVGMPGPYGFGTTPTDARPVLTAGGGGHGGGGHGGHGGRGGHGRGGYGWRGYGGGWWGPWYPSLEIVTPTVDGDAANICAWALQSADSATLRLLIQRYAALPSVVACLSQRLAQIAPSGL